MGRVVETKGHPPRSYRPTNQAPRLRLNGRGLQYFLTVARRVILLAYYYPPLIGAASERARSLSRHLDALGWEPTVITPRNGFYHRAAEEEEIKANVVRTGSVEISRLLRSAYTGGRSSGNEGPAEDVQMLDTGRLGSWARRFVRDYAYVPDAQVGWIPFAAAAARRATRAALPTAVIYSTSVPYSAHLAAMLAARGSPRAPWVAEFRDPWVSSVSRLRRNANTALEAAIVRSADHLVVTAPGLRNRFLATYEDLPTEKVSVITNGFESAAEQPTPSPHEPMTVLYAGTVAPGEDMAPVLAEFARLADRQCGKFRLRVLGPPGPWRQSDIPDGGRSWLVLDGVVSPAQARQAMARSSVLLHVRRHPSSRDVLPGKLFEYIGARRPIVAVCPSQSDMGSLLRKYADARFVTPETLEELIGVLEELIDQHARGLIQAPRVPESVTAPLRRSEQAKRLAAIFANVVERPGRRVRNLDIQPSRQPPF